MASDPDSLLGSVIAGAFRIDALIATGAVGTVYRAHELEVGRDVALKVLHESSMRRDAVARFESEALALSRLRHRGCVELKRWGATDSMRYLVMELIEGPELRDLMRRPLRPVLAIALLTQMLDALAHIHERGLVHRDVKPENILVSRDDARRRRLTLVDFGVTCTAGRTGPGLTRVDKVIGTPEYMSPEQALGRPDLDGRSDVYAAGIILFEMLAGARPFDAREPEEVMRMQASAPLPPLPRFVPLRVRRFVGRLLEKHRDERPCARGAHSEAQNMLGMLRRSPGGPMRAVFQPVSLRTTQVAPAGGWPKRLDELVATLG